MSYIPAHQVWAEMARRKKRFHNNTDWSHITLWGLWYKSDITHMIKDGELTPWDGKMPQDRCLAWWVPSEEAYHKYIEPLLEYSLDDLTKMAGW